MTDSTAPTKKRISAPGVLVSDYLVRDAQKARRLILLLHGYQQTGEIMMRKFAACCPEDAVLLAPNAPYPVPERRDDGGYREGYSWYFYHPATDEYIIDMANSWALLRKLTEQPEWRLLPKTVVGFSQGGYLALLLAEKLSDVEQVVGIASEYLVDELESKGPLSFRVDAIHGEKDGIVRVEGAQKSHSRVLAERGAMGRFVNLAGVDHRIVPEMQEALKALLI